MSKDRNKDSQKIKNKTIWIITRNKNDKWGSQKIFLTYMKTSRWWWLHSLNSKNTPITISPEKVILLFKSICRSQTCLRMSKYNNWRRKKLFSLKEKGTKEWKITAGENKIPPKYRAALNIRKNSKAIIFLVKKTNLKGKMITGIVSTSL